jgi:hypothetical protein
LGIDNKFGGGVKAFSLCEVNVKRQAKGRIWCEQVFDPKGEAKARKNKEPKIVKSMRILKSLVLVRRHILNLIIERKLHACALSVSIAPLYYPWIPSFGLVWFGLVFLFI